ncbi:MAG TPA: SRPBCC family protein [Polyangiaceae bacterium]
MSEPTRAKNRTKIERTSDRERVITRTINGPARLVYEAWTKPEIFERWWVPKGSTMSLLSCELDVRVGGKYRLVFGFGGAKTMAFFGTYTEVVPASRLVWTNEEDPAGGPVSTLTFEERGDATLLVLTERYPSKEALEATIAEGIENGVPEFDQLDEHLAAR